MFHSFLSWVRAPFLGSRPTRRRPRCGAAIEFLEPRQLLTLTLVPSVPVDLPAGKAEYIPLTATNTSQTAISFSAQSSDPNVTANVLSGGRSIRLTVTGIDSTNAQFTGVLTFRLFEAFAPQTTSRIINLVNAGFYNGLTFHRVINGFVAQGGDPLGTGAGGSGVTLNDEFSPALTFNSSGLLAMANSGDDTSDSQFFITDTKLPLAQMPQYLNFNYTIFGVLTSGFDTFQQLITTPTDANNRPLTREVINSAQVFTDTQNGVLQVSAPNGFTGSTTITVNASDGVPETDSQQFNLNVVPNTVNDPPILGPVGNLTTSEGTPLTFQVQGIDLQNDPLTFVVKDPAVFSNAVTTAPPQNVAVNIVVAPANGAAPSTAAITLTPAVNFTGTVNLLVGVRDQTNRVQSPGTLDSRSNFDTQKITLTVTANSSPVLTATPAGTPLSQTALFFKGLDNQVYEQRFDANQTLIQATTLTAPGTVGAMQAVTLADGSQVLFVIGLDNQVYEQKFTPSGTSSGGYALTQPGNVKSITATTTAGGIPLVFAIGMDDQVYVQSFDATGASKGPFAPTSSGKVLSMVASGSPGFAPATPFVFVLGLDNKVYQEHLTGSTWSSYQLTTGGRVQSISYSGAGQFFAVGLDNQVYEQKFDANGNNAGGYILTTPGKVKAIAQGLYSGKTELFAIGNDGQAYVQRFDAAGTSTGGYYLASPGTVKSITPSPLPGSPALYAVGADDRVYKLNIDNVTGNSVDAYAATNSGRIS